MKEIKDINDKSYEEAYKQAVIREAELILESSDNYRDYQIKLDAQSAKVLQDGICEVYEQLFHPDIEKMDQEQAHPENAVRVLHHKLHSAASAQSKDENVIQLNAREVDMLGDAVMQSQVWDMYDKDTIYPWDVHKYQTQSEAIVSIIGQFEKQGGTLLASEAKEYFILQSVDEENPPDDSIYLYTE